MMNVALISNIKLKTTLQPLVSTWLDKGLQGSIEGPGVRGRRDHDVTSPGTFAGNKCLRSHDYGRFAESAGKPCPGRK
jgi:hypothetical protein